MSDYAIAKAIAEMCLFFENSDEATIDPDAAICAMEQLAANLQLASVASRQELVAGFRLIATDYPSEEAFISSLGETLGLE